MNPTFPGASRLKDSVHRSAGPPVHRLTSVRIRLYFTVYFNCFVRYTHPSAPAVFHVHVSVKGDGMRHLRVLALGMVCLLAANASAQTTSGSMSGTVVDDSDQV